MNFLKSLSGAISFSVQTKQLKKQNPQPVYIKPQNLAYSNDTSNMNKSEPSTQLNQKETQQKGQHVNEHHKNSDKQISIKVEQNKHEKEQKMLNPQKNIQQIKEGRNKYQNMKSFIDSENLENIQRIVTQRLEQKYKAQYENLLECLALNKTKYFNLQKKYKYLLEVIQKSKELKHQIQKSFSKNQQYSSIKNLQDFKNVQIQSSFNQFIDFKAELKEDIQKIKQNKLSKNQSSTKDKSTVVKNIIAPYTQKNLQKQIAKLSSQLQLIKNRYQMRLEKQNLKIKQSSQISQKVQKQLQIKQNQVDLVLAKHFPFALKYKLRVIYTYLLKIHKKQTFNYEEQKKEDQVMNIIDSTLKQYKITQVGLKYANQYNFEFLARKLQSVNFELQNFVQPYFDKRLTQLKNTFYQVISCTFNEKIKKHQFSQREIFEQIVEFLNKANPYNLICNQLRDIVKNKKKILIGQITNIFRKFSKFILQIQTKKEQSFQKYNSIFFWMLNFLKLLGQDLQIKSQLSLYFEVVQNHLKQIVKSFLLKRLIQCTQSINKIRSNSQKCKINARDTNIQFPLTAKFIGQKKQIIQILKTYVEVEYLIFLINIYLERMLLQELKQQNSNKADLLSEVKLFMQEDFWSKYLKEDFLKSIKNYQIQQILVTDFIIIEEMQEVYQRQNQLKKVIPQSVKSYYQNHIKEIHKIKQNFLNKNIYLLDKFSKKQIDLDTQTIKLRFPSSKNEFHITHSIIFEESYLKILKNLTYFPQNSKLIFKKQSAIKKIQEKLQKQFEELKDFFQTEYQKKQMQNKILEIYNNQKSFHNKIYQYHSQFKILSQFKDLKAKNQKLKQRTLLYLLEQKKDQFLNKLNENKRQFQNYASKKFQVRKINSALQNFKESLKDLKDILKSCYFHVKYLEKLYKLDPKQYQKMSKQFRKIKYIAYEYKTNLLNFWKENLAKISQQIGKNVSIETLYLFYDAQLLDEHKQLVSDFEDALIKIFSTFEQKLQKADNARFSNQENNYLQKVQIIIKIKDLQLFYLKNKKIFTLMVQKRLNKLILSANRLSQVKK